jgi:NADH pyrophosphatase NudC (nudix superfamily)
VLVTIIGLAIVLLAALYVAWPMLQDVPSAAPTVPDTEEGAPEHDKERALLAIREADFDHRTGKLSDEDYAALRAELEARALSAMSAIESASALHPVPSLAAATAATAPAASQAARGGEPGGFCPACGVRFVRDARFCSGCGQKLPAAPQRGRRRA